MGDLSPEAVGLAKGKLAADGASSSLAAAFGKGLERLIEGDSGLIDEASISPLEGVEDLETLPDGGSEGKQALDRTVVIKLNGGLGTGMGMTRAKSLIEAHAGMSFLDVIARQVLWLRESASCRLPLVLMNSFATQADSRRALLAHAGIEADVPLDFLQNRVPKLRAEDLEPVDWPPDRELEWAPPGHGDIYSALSGSGMLGALLDAGYRHAFISNADNLAAVVDRRILGWMVREGVPFVMEAAERTEADRKGGHLALDRRGGLLLREIAQTADGDLGAFQDTGRHRFFNTNNIWLDLEALAGMLEAGGGALDLPLIVNRKTVDPKDPGSPEVLQLETAMGAAISLFPGARALRVPRSRFSPVKTTGDLLVLRSDASTLADDFSLTLASSRKGVPPVVDLDPAFFRLLDQFDGRFPHGPPSLVACSRLAVRGDVRFGSGIRVEGDVEIRADDGEVAVPDGALLSG